MEEQKSLHVLRCPVFTKSFGIVNSKIKVYTSSDALFSTESIGEEEKKSSLIVIRPPIFSEALGFSLGMCLKENYSDSPSNEYSRHYSAESESEYLRRQNMNSKLDEEQKNKVIMSVEVLISTQIRIKSKKKIKMVMV